MNMKRICVFMLLVLAMSGVACGQNVKLRKGVYINNDLVASITMVVHPDMIFDPNNGLSQKSGSYVIVAMDSDGVIFGINVGQVKDDRINITAFYDGLLNYNFNPSSPNIATYVIVNSQTFRMENNNMKVTFVWNRESN